MNRPLFRGLPLFVLGLVSVLATGVVGTTVAEAQAPSTQPDGQPSSGEPLAATEMETVDVEVAGVEVYVTDDKGRTVDGLRAEDFRLFVDNDPSEIVNFFRAGGASAAGAIGPGESVGTVERAAAPESMVVAGEVPASAQAAKPMTLVLYVDNLQLTQSGRRSFLRQIREFLDSRLAPGDQVMVVSHGGSLELEQRFSGDLSGLEAVLERMWKAPAGAHDYELRWRGAMDEIEAIIMSTPRTQDPCTARGEHIRKVGVDYAEWVTSQVERSLAGLQRMVQVLSGFEGRKAILYLSNGLHQSPGADMLLKMADICTARTFETVNGELVTFVSSRAYELTRLANASDITIHTLDATGLAGNASAGVMSSRKLDHYGQTYDLRVTPVVDRLRRDSSQGTLHTLAHETGGLAVLNANEIGGDLEKIEDSLRRFYSLGFRPPDDGDRVASHLLRVELEPPRKGHTLHYRRTYEATAPADRTVGNLMSALLLGMEDNPLGVGIELGPPQVGDTGLPTVALRLSLPFGSLGWLQEGDHRTGEVELFIAVQDGDGQDVDMRRKKIPFRIQESLWTEAKGKSHVLEIGLPVPSADARLAFAVADRVGARTSYLSQTAGTGGSSGIATGF